MQSQDRKWKAELATCNQFGQRLTDDGIRRGNVGGGALVYRKKVDENSGYPHRSSIRALDKPSLKTPGEQSGLSILVWMHAAKLTRRSGGALGKPSVVRAFLPLGKR
jgi:hypothetical protein